MSTPLLSMKKPHGTILYDPSGNKPVAVVIGSYESGGEEPWEIFGRRVWLAVGLSYIRSGGLTWLADTTAGKGYNVEIPGITKVGAGSNKLASSITGADASGLYVSSQSQQVNMDMVLSAEPTDSATATDALLAFDPNMAAAKYCRQFEIQDLGGMDLPSIAVLYRLFQSRAVIDSLDITIPSHSDKVLNDTDVWGMFDGGSQASTVWSSTPATDNSYTYTLNSNGYARGLSTRNMPFGVIPVKEIPDEQVVYAFDGVFIPCDYGLQEAKEVQGTILRNDENEPTAVIIGSFQSGGQLPWNIRGREVWLAVGLASTRAGNLPWCVNTGSNSPGYSVNIPNLPNVAYANNKALASSNTGVDGAGRYVSVLSSEENMDALTQAPVLSKAATTAILAYNPAMQAAAHCRVITTSMYGPMDLPSIDVLMRIYQARDMIDALDPTLEDNPDMGLKQGTWGVFGSSGGSDVWSSSPYSIVHAWDVSSSGYVIGSNSRNVGYGVVPVTEIPVALNLTNRSRQAPEIVKAHIVL